MSPVLRSGQKVLVDPNKVPQRGDIVIIIGNKRATVDFFVVCALYF